MYELKKFGKVFTSKFVGNGPSSYKKRIFRAAVLQRLRKSGLEYGIDDSVVAVVQLGKKKKEIVFLFATSLRPALVCRPT